MTEITTTRNRPFLAWVIRACDWLWSKVVVWFWSAVFVGGAVAALITWLGDHHQFAESLNWAHENLALVLIITLSLIFVSVIIGVVRLLPVAESERAMKRRYLADIGLRKGRLDFGGIPAEYAAGMVRLEDVFIPPLFHISEPLDIYAPTKEDLVMYEQRRNQGVEAQEAARILLESKRVEKLKGSDKVDVAVLWEHLTEERPVAVIQGFAGMGKSTLLNRLTLHMARRYLKKSDVDATFTKVTPALIPIFVSLKEYATRYEQEKLSLLDYIKFSVRRFPALATYIEKWLSDCSCLVLLDGLDEVSNERTRQAVQQAIREFCDEQRHPDKKNKRTYNRFLITSRVSGYDTKAFKDYCPHYLIADLNMDQIAGFLPRWCQSNVRRDGQNISEELMRREAKETADRLMRSVEKNQGVRKLAENPLLLTLLASMQQKGVELPRSRAQLYKTVTKTILEERNKLKGINPLPVATAIQRLGPVAYRMHAEGNSFARKTEVVAMLEQTMGNEQSSI